ncbi:MAG: hypothetical protein ACKVT2_09255 [Saprospiraceae bacterium]
MLTVLSLLFASCETTHPSSEKGKTPISIDMWLSTNEIAYDKALIGFLKVKNNSKDTLKLTNEAFGFKWPSDYSGITLGEQFFVLEPYGTIFRSINYSLDTERIKMASDTIAIQLECKINGLVEKSATKCQVIHAIPNTNEPDHLAFLKILNTRGTTKPIVDFLQTDEFQNSKYYLTVLKLYLYSIEYYELNYKNETSAKYLIDLIESGETDQQEKEFRLWQLGEFYCKTPLKDKVEGFISRMKNYQNQAKAAIAKCKTKQ